MVKQLWEQLAALRERMRPLESRVRALVARGQLRTWSDGEGLGRGQFVVLVDEVEDRVESLSMHGFCSRPAPGAEALLLAPGGDPAGRVALVFDRRKRLAGVLAEGEAALYIGNAGQVVRLKANGDVVITPGAGGSVLLGAEGATKKVALADDVDARLTKLQVALDSHVHATAAPGPPVPPTPVPGVLPVGALAPTGATKVKGA